MRSSVKPLLLCSLALFAQGVFVSAAHAASLSDGFSNFYVNPNSSPKTWVAQNPNDSRSATIRDKIANQAAATWFGDWNKNINSEVSSYVGAAANAGKVPILVVYNIPNRDCGAYSAGGAKGGDAYKAWVAALASGIGSRQAVVVLEPDALMQLDCLPSDTDRNARLALFNYAIDQFVAKAPNALLYIDAGNSAWKSPAETATRLIKAGVKRARGFALNVSNYRASSELNDHGNKVNAQLQAQGGFTRTFVIDSSRNGNGPKGSEWCDPSGRKIGATSKVLTFGKGMEMTLWLKIPGEADGCAGSAGSFVPQLAYNLSLGV